MTKSRTAKKPGSAPSLTLVIEYGTILYFLTRNERLQSGHVMQVQQQLARGDAYATATRSDWDAFDPQLIAEALFATANILSILKLIHFCTISSHLGPLQLTLGRMVNDVVRFMILALLVCFAFSCGVNQLYGHYATQEIRMCEVQCNATHVEDCICDRSLAEYVTPCFFGRRLYGDGICFANVAF